MSKIKRSKNYFLSLAKSRKTVYEFTDRIISVSNIKNLLEAARWSPSCSNIQPWKFIVIEDKKKISELIGTTSYGAFYSDPPLIIAIVLDSNSWKKSDHRCIINSKLGIYEAFISIGMPALSITFEATELGIGSAILTPKDRDAKKILKLKNLDQINSL